MSFIVFNTLKKAEHYVNYLNKMVYNTYDDQTHCYVSGNKVIREHSYEWFCGSSEPENGYICCSGYTTDVAVIGRIKNLSYEKDYCNTEGNI